MERALIVMVAVVTATACSPDAPPPAAPVVVAKAEAAPAPAPAPVAVAPAAPAPEPKADPNKELAKRVMRALEGEAKIHAAAIDVTAAGGVVTLWGTAATPDEKQRASRIAYRVIGVTAVENKLAIASGS
jgi:hyperosmotically inducible protein